MRTLDFSDHSRSLNDNRYVYAVVSRRVGGLSIGLNLNPDKICNFACPYCQVDRREIGGEQRIDCQRLGVELDTLLGWVADDSLWARPPFDTTALGLRRVGDICFAGDGEPTASPDFVESVKAVIAVRAAHGLRRVPLTLMSNASLFDRPRVREGMDLLHQAGAEIWAKLDAGTADWFKRVDGTGFSFERVLENISFAAQRYGVVIQSMFHTFNGVGPSDAEVEAWVGRLASVVQAGGHIKAVQVYTVARRPADDTVGELAAERLVEIAGAARGIEGVRPDSVRAIV